MCLHSCQGYTQGFWSPHQSTGREENSEKPAWISTQTIYGKCTPNEASFWDDTHTVQPSFFPVCIWETESPGVYPGPLKNPGIGGKLLRRRKVELTPLFSCRVSVSGINDKIF